VSAREADRKNEGRNRARSVAPQTPASSAAAARRPRPPPRRSPERYGAQPQEERLRQSAQKALRT